MGITQATDSKKKTSNKTAPANHQKFHRRGKARFNPNAFYWLYDRSDIHDDKEILFVDNLPVVHKSTTIEQAKGLVRSDIHRMGGNAGLYLSVEKESQIRKSWAYDPWVYEVSAYASLVTPKNLNEKEKDRLLSKFKGNIKYSKNLQKESGFSKKGIALMLATTAIIVCLLIFLVNLYKQ